MMKDATPISKWAAIAGLWQFDGPKATYVEPDPRLHFGFGIAIGPPRLRSGIIKSTITYAENAEANEARIIFGYSSRSRDYFSAGLGGYGNAYVIDEFLSSRGWQALAAAGSRQNLRAPGPYSLEVRITGQEVSLRADDILVVECGLSRPLPGDQVGLLAVGPGPVTFTSTLVQVTDPRAFVVMQYGEPFDSLYSEVIRPVCSEVGLEAFRADDVHKPGIILQDIISGIIESEIIIAEITPPNPNVFYELGYSHALAKNSILLAERGKELPFDIRSYRCIFYDNTIRGKRDVETHLRKHLASILGER